MSDAVLGYAGYAQEAEQIYHVPKAVLLGLVSVESNGDASVVSSAGAKGSTQFLPSTASSYGVEFGTSPAAKKSQVLGAARYLVALGYHVNPQKALASYNAGPGNWQAGLGYAGTVLARAKRYGTVHGTTAAPSSTPATAPTPSSTTAPGTALKLLTQGGLVLGGAALFLIGATRAAGLRRRIPA